MPTLANSTVRFHTNDEDKDDDTHVTVTINDDNNVVAARISNDFGHFDDHSDAGPFGLEIRGQARGVLIAHLDALGAQLGDRSV
jgi:hypothetical protein